MPTHTYVINLDRSTDRLAEFRRVNDHLPAIYRFAALEGATADREDLIASGIIDQQLQYSEGALGCALSHIFFWDTAVESGETITIAEDDAIFHRRFVHLSDSFIGALPSDWDLVMWGWNFDSILLIDLLPGVSPCLCTFNQEQLRTRAAEYATTQIEPRPFRLYRCFGTICYTVSAAGARKLKAGCLPLRPLTVDFPLVNPCFPNNGIDIAMNSVYPAINAYASFPPLVITKNEHEASTVQESQ